MLEDTLGHLETDTCSGTSEEPISLLVLFPEDTACAVLVSWYPLTSVHQRAQPKCCPLPSQAPGAQPTYPSLPRGGSVLGLVGGIGCV